MKRKKGALRVVAATAFCLLAAAAWAFPGQKELARPTATIISIEHSPTDTAAVEYIKNNIQFGLYAWLSFSVTHVDPVLAWGLGAAEADAGIQSFKTSVDSYIAAAKAAGVRFHLVICSGLARGLWIYEAAKQEDVRNCQWYNDNDIASAAQAAQPGYLNQYVFATFSRYAVKMRRNLSAKSRAAMAFIKKRMDEEPDTLAAVSGWGEAEMNFNRIDYAQAYPTYFCDYSPFAVMEFKDWIRHTLIYDDRFSKLFPGQGYAAGGARYQGADGLANFNADFGTSFATWDLKYYNWQVGDWDGGAIPIGSYVQGGMMPDSGPHYIPGGFDPPRRIMPGDKFWDLWNLFRETMVRNLLLDLAYDAQKAGLDPEKWFTHQIPGDYLFGTNPASEPKNTRYYTSASPFWTADVRPYGGVGATVYDVKFPGWFARTSQYFVPAAEALGARWAVLEYDAESYPQGYGVAQSSVAVILEQYNRIYSGGPSLINFWRWVDWKGESQIYGTNKEAALRAFVEGIRDSPVGAFSRDMATPPGVEELAADPDRAAGGGVRLTWSERIWPDAPWKWSDWGGFGGFEIYRGGKREFESRADNMIGRTRESEFLDRTAVQGEVYYYKIRAVNARREPGPLSREAAIPFQ